MQGPLNVKNGTNYGGTKNDVRTYRDQHKTSKSISVTFSNYRLEYWLFCKARCVVVLMQANGLWTNERK